MIDIETYKKSLGDAGKKLSKPEMLAFRDLQYALANTLFSSWAKKNSIVSSKGVMLKHDNDGNCIAIFAYQFLYVTK